MRAATRVTRFTCPQTDARDPHYGHKPKEVFVFPIDPLSAILGFVVGALFVRAIAYFRR